MTGIERNDANQEHGPIDHVLGEGTPEQRAAMRDRIAEDVDLALECGELRTMFDQMRELTVEPSGEVELAVRYAIDRRKRLQIRRNTSSQPRWVVRSTQVAAVAAATLFAFVWIHRLSHTALRPNGVKVGSAVEHLNDGRTPPPRDAELARLLSTTNVPVSDSSFHESLAQFESVPLPESFSGWVDAVEELADLRAQFRLRFSPTERHQVLHSIGAPNLDDRLDSLAASLAEQIDRKLESEQANTYELSIGLRAMLAAGSSRHDGPHRDTVTHAAVELVDRLTRADGGDGIDEGLGASVLAALSDLAVIEGGQLVEIVGLYAESLARVTLSEREGGRPRLLHWQTPTTQLADAGRVLRIAPAFGVHAGLAFRARMMVAAHLEERLQARPGVERPTLIAAQLYGFGDLIDRGAAERALRLWSPRLLVPNFVALHHIAWSKLPERPGWAQFQQDLRELSSVSTPTTTRDAAALLLCLTMNFASPGAIQVPRGTA